MATARRSASCGCEPACRPVPRPWKLPTYNLESLDSIRSPGMAPVIRAYSYMRFSRARQAKGDSARRQGEKVVEYCQQHGLLLDDSLDLRDFGVSAFRGRHRKRGALSQFLEGVETGRI